MDKSQSNLGIHHGRGSWNIVSLHLQWTQLALCPCTAYEGSSHTPLPKDKHLGILPQGKAEENSYGQISQLEVHQLLSARSQVVYPVGLNGEDEPITNTLPELLSSSASVTANKHPYMRIDNPHLPWRNQNIQLCQLTRCTPSLQLDIPPKPRVSIVAEVDDLLTQAMEDASSCKSKCSPTGKVTTVEAVTSPPWRSEASPQLVNISSQTSMEEAKASLEGLPANVSPITAAYSSRSASPPADPMELQNDVNRAADHMLCLRRSTDLKRQRVIWELGVLLHQSEVDKATSVAKAKVIHSWEVLDAKVSPRGQMQLSSGC